MIKSYRGEIFVLVSAFAYGLMPIFALYSYGRGVSVATLLFLRFGVATIVFLPFLVLRARLFNTDRSQKRVLFAVAGGLYVLQAAFYFISVKFMPVSLAVIIVYTYPMIVHVVSHLLRREKFQAKSVLSLMLSFLGLVFLLGDSIKAVNSYGIMMAFGASLSCSLYVLLSSKILRGASSLEASAYIVFWTALCYLVIGTLTGTISLDFEFQAWIPIVGLAVVSTVIAVITFFRGLRILGPSKASVLAMMEPVFAVTLAMIVFHEQMTLIQIAGGVAVIAGSLIVAAEKRETVI